MKKILFLFSLSLLIQVHVAAQSEADRAFIKSQTNTKVLKELADKFNEKYIESLQKSALLGIKQQIINSQNEIGYLSGLDQEGNPIYDFDDNLGAAETIGVDHLRVGGDSGLDLDGSGIQIGHWEAGGLALTTHQEYIGRVTHLESEAVTSHATHTAGTMIGSGVNPNARGMAPAATIVSRRSSNDEEEIANFASAGGILSNHSYSSGNPDGMISGYGYYTANSQEWDEILYNAPYLSLCKSAGNTRNDGVNTGDNGYDIIFTTALCKNILTIGAVNDAIPYTGPQSITHSAFSSWGPTDDWRIKPDFVAVGVSVYSADNDNNSDYGSKSGTSMSTPTVTGAIALLQQHYHNINGMYMKAATVKALLIGTTHEAGANDGPDFEHGWGLVNAEKAAEVISNNFVNARIEELSLNNGETYTTTIESDGLSPLSLTIAWTDPAGRPGPGGTDVKTPLLINDLDVKVTQGATTYEPWVMTPNTASNNFTDAATKGNNFRDNVERIDVATLPEGEYTVTVSHKDSLTNGLQDFSMVITGIVENTSSTVDLSDKFKFPVYPNPIENGYVQIIIPNELDASKSKIEIFDLQGKLIQGTVHSEREIKLDVSKLQSGMYTLSIQLEEGFYQQFIVIE